MRTEIDTSAPPSHAILDGAGVTPPMGGVTSGRGGEDLPMEVARPLDVRWRGRLVRCWRQAGPFAVPLVLLSTMQWAGTLASPALIERTPLLLVLLSPRAPFLLYASATSPLGLFLFVASFRMLLADPLNYCIGRRFGPAVTQRWASAGRRAAVVRASERVFDRCGLVAVTCRPNAMMLALAGARRLNPWATATAAVTGTVAYATALALTADAAADPSQRLAAWARQVAAPAWHELASAPATQVVLIVAAVVLSTALWFLTRARLRPLRA